VALIVYPVGFPEEIGKADLSYLPAAVAFIQNKSLFEKVIQKRSGVSIKHPPLPVGHDSGLKIEYNNVLSRGGLECARFEMSLVSFSNRKLPPSLQWKCRPEREMLAQQLEKEKIT